MKEAADQANRFVKKVLSQHEQQLLILRLERWEKAIADPLAVYPDANIHPYVADRYRSDARKNRNRLLQNHPELLSLKQKSRVQ